VEGYNLLGIIYSSEGHYAQALDAFQQALGVDPKSARTRNNIGNVYVAQQNLALRSRNSEKSYSWNLPTATPITIWAWFCSPRSAGPGIAYFQRVRPSNNATRLNLTRAYFGSGRNAEALKTAAEASSQSKEDVQLHFTLGVLLAGKTIQSRASRTGTSQRAQSRHVRDPLQPGTTTPRNAEYDKAELELGRALKRKPDSPETLYLLAQAYPNRRNP